MRIKFEKGFTPERMAQSLVNYIRQNNLVIGSVNIYIQTYDDEMKPEKFKRGEEEYLVCTPTEIAKKEYDKDVATIRRSKMKAVV